MSIWGKLAGAAAGLAIGGPIGALLGGVAGHYVIDRDKEEDGPAENQVAFTVGVIALGAKMAKADGVVTMDEVNAFKEVFKVPEGEMKNVARVFNLAKQDVVGYDSYARQLARLFGQRPQVLEDVVDSLFHIAKADGAVHERELVFLQSVAEIFGFTPGDFVRIKARHIVPAHDDPYVVLGIEPIASDEELRKHYATEGGEPMPMTPQEFRNYVLAEVQRWRLVVKETGISLQ